MTMSILDTCTPRKDLLAGTFNPEIFTANLMQVIGHYRGETGVVENIYTDPLAFFGEGTYPTEGMRLMLRNIFGRLKGTDASFPAIQRSETAFGGGKTHTLIAATHLAYRGTEIADAAQELIDADLLLAPGAVTVVGIAGDRVAIHETKGSRLIPYTLWGEIAYQIGGEDIYREIGSTATSFGSPGDEYFDVVLKGRRVLIMLDELAAYAARVEAARPGGRSSVATFLMSLFQYAKDHIGISVVLTLASQKDAFARQTAMLSEIVSKAKGEEVSKTEALDIARRADGEVRSVVARDVTTVTPVRGQEISRVLARRLFGQIDQEGAASTADAYMDMYRRTATLLPEAARQETFRERMVAHYPFHPTLVDYLTGKLSTVETFQGTRGVLRVLALTVSNLWKKHTAVPAIHTCHLDLRDHRLSDELISRTESAELLPIITADIGGADSGDLSAQDSNAALMDKHNPHPEGFSLFEDTWKTVFLHSLAGFGEGLASNVFGINKQDALFATAFPGMTPPQVETALDAIRSNAYYLRYSETEGRYYASTGVSINRVLADIRRGLRGSDRIEELLSQTSRKVVTAGQHHFEVIPEVSVPERIPDKTGKPTLALIALDANSIKPDELITQAGPNRPRIEQNLVLLLIPDTVNVTGDHRAGDDMLDNQESRALELRDRLQSIAVDVLARRILKQDPAAYGLSESALSDQTFSRDTKEREQALITVVTQAYRNLWFPGGGGGGQGGKIIRREISTAGGEGGVSVIERIKEVLLNDGELVTAELAGSTTAGASAAKLFFANQDYRTLADLRADFARRRDWPLLEEPSVFDTLIRAGVNHGAWCLFRMGEADSEKPTEFHSRDTGEIPYQVTLTDPGWSVVTPQGAKKRSWTESDKPDPARIRQWVQDEINATGYCSVAEIAAKVEQDHGSVATPDICKAVDELIKGGHFYVHTVDKNPDMEPDALRGASDWVMETVSPEYKVVTKPEASKRGWVTKKPTGIQIGGDEAKKKVLPLLKQIAQIYKSGGKSTIDYLEVSGLQFPQGGIFNIQLQNLAPEDVRTLDELLDVAIDLTEQQQAEVQLVISAPQPDCKLVERLRS
jgi:hypothetical protein